jgi:hypothetical protein
MVIKGGIVMGIFKFHITSNIFPTFFTNIISTSTNLKISDNPRVADATALQSDWNQVGEDMAFAINKYKEETNVGES